MVETGGGWRTGGATCRVVFDVIQSCRPWKVWATNWTHQDNSWSARQAGREREGEWERGSGSGGLACLSNAIGAAFLCLVFPPATPHGSSWSQAAFCFFFLLPLVVCFLFAWLLVCFSFCLSLAGPPSPPPSVWPSGRPIYVHVALHCILQGAAE